ncbi:hypothetical protein H6P81_013771 [Aristolochia fimbriata]|uniref:Uncharacterized protein n=1 Tax=Aristolochia fimbriata TaxID=158543 RepID=A0AAV7EFV9_ARIFI|nr:hypothetical protein H6P81_013771 [Aristolochia fimbriata]
MLRYSRFPNSCVTSDSRYLPRPGREDRGLGKGARHGARPGGSARGLGTGARHGGSARVKGKKGRTERSQRLLGLSKIREARRQMRAPTDEGEEGAVKYPFNGIWREARSGELHPLLPFTPCTSLKTVPAAVKAGRVVHVLGEVDQWCPPPTASRPFFFFISSFE